MRPCRAVTGEKQEPATCVAFAEQGWVPGGRGLKSGSLKAHESCGSSLLASWLVWIDIRHKAECPAWSLGCQGRLRLKVEQLLSGPLRCSTASEAPGLGPKLDSRPLRFLKVGLKVVPQICSEQAEGGLREGILSSVDTLLFQHQIWQVAKGE